MMVSGSSTVSYGYIQARQLREAVDALTTDRRQYLVGILEGQDTPMSPTAQYTLDLLRGKRPTVRLGYRRSQSK
jgi:hypothetical protein